MIKTNVAFLEGRLLSSQLEQFGKKPAFQKSHFYFDHVNNWANNMARVKRARIPCFIVARAPGPWPSNYSRRVARILSKGG